MRRHPPETAQFGKNMNDLKKYLSYGVVLLGMLTLLAGCGDGSSSSGSSQTDQGTPTTLVTAANGVSTQICAPNAQCISPLFTKLAEVSNKLSIAATPWTNTSTNIITIAQTPYVEGAVTAAQIDPAGSVFSITTDDKYRYFQGNGLPSTPMGSYPVQPGTAAYHTT
jgi:hypothetical protein